MSFIYTIKTSVSPYFFCEVFIEMSRIYEDILKLFLKLFIEVAIVFQYHRQY